MATELGAQIVGQGMMGLFSVNPSLGYYESAGNLVWTTPITVNAESELFGMESAFYGSTPKRPLFIGTIAAKSVTAL